MKFRIGIVGVSGYGGGEALRICSGHPSFDVVYVAGESSAGAKLVEKFPGVAPKLANLVIEKWDPTKLPRLDLLFVSLPTGESSNSVSRAASAKRVVDIGGDHRYADGWTYGLADIFPEEVRKATRVANPGCYPSAALLAIAPLLRAKLVDPKAPIIIDAKSGVSGAGRGGASAFGFSETNEDLVAYGLLKHAHVPEISATIKRMQPDSEVRVAFTPHLVPMTRGILATCYLTPTSDDVTTERCMDAAREFYAKSAFVRVVDRPPHTKWATGTNLCFVNYAANPGGPIIALAAIDNLGKGAAGQAVQNANLMLGLPETEGLEAAPIWP